ncbi:hypothetical protein [Leucobacter sp. M11]|uniref:hypothetical protein n=1 Tax=Leucobacter sp. M11 TaxID=2993565 RepID=UPI002D7F7332|nr:hypothetical protein [Leucobacter sp. M11]MEB4615765.1 hypothetical protein [Leucobacter sp. M11]
MQKTTPFRCTILAAALTACLAVGSITGIGSVASAEEPERAAIDINDVPIAVGDPEPGAVGDESTHNVGQGVFLPYPGSDRGYWAGAFSMPRGLPGDLQQALWWCMTVGPWQALEFHDVYEVNASALSYVFATKSAIDTPESRAAIASIVHGQYDTGSDVRPKEESRATWMNSLNEHYPDVAALAAQYLAEGEQYGGPYTTDGFQVVPMMNAVGKPQLNDAAHPLWSVDGIGVLSQAGFPVPGHEITLTIDGELEWEAGGKTLVMTSAETLLSARAFATGNGSATVRMTVAKTLPGGTVVIGSQPGHQTMVGEKPVYLSAEASDTVEVELHFRPEAISSVAKKLVDNGVLEDNLEVFPAADTMWLKRNGAFIPVVFDGTAYSTGEVPPEQQTEIPEGASVVGTAQITANRGPGVYGPATIEGVDPQFITWVWEVKAASQFPEYSEFIESGWKDAFGVPDETASVRHPLEIVSSLSVRETVDGIFLVDDQWRTGFPENHGGFAGTERFAADVAVVTNSLHFVPGPEWPTATSCTAATLQTSTTSPAKNGFDPVSAYSFKVDESLGEGTWVVVHSFPGDDRVQPFESSCDDRTQSYQVKTPTPDRELVVTTLVHTSTGKPPVAGDGGSLLDTHLITGEIKPGDGGVSELYFVKTGEELVCSEETQVWTSERLDYEQAKPQQESENSFTITTKTGYAYGENAGTYSFIEHATDAEGELLSRGKCGASSETIVVKPQPEVPTVPEEPEKPKVPGKPGVPSVPVAPGRLATTGAGGLGALAAVTALLLLSGATVLIRRRVSSGGE